MKYGKDGDTEHSSKGQRGRGQFRGRSLGDAGGGDSAPQCIERTCRKSLGDGRTPRLEGDCGCRGMLNQGEKGH